ncbi:DUF362 domain-containing protein [Thermodesulfobacteriota bacterium]
MPRNYCRRQFLKTGLMATATALAGTTGRIVDPNYAHAAGHPDIAIARGRSPKANTRSAVDALGGMGRFVKPGNKVVIKPNMSFARGPKQGNNTNPEVVAEVARMCSEAGASSIAVLDYVLHSPEDCLRMSQIPRYCENIPNTLVSNVSNKRLFREAKVPKAREVKTMEVITDVLNADVLIAVPVGKSHSAAGVSFSMKGMMGLIFDRRSFHGRYNLHEAIVDMASLLKPNLVVIDGTRILSTGGPGGPGKVIQMDMVIASDDMVAADAQMLALGTWYGRKFKPNQVKHIRMAAERGLGRIDLDKLNIKEIKG